MSFYSRIRSGNVNIGRFIALTLENVRDIPAPNTVTLAMVEDELNVHGAESDEMQQIMNLFPPGGNWAVENVRAVLELAHDNVPGYQTDDEMKAKLNIT